MTISVALSKWGPRIRAQVQKFNDRWPTFSWGTYPGHDPNESLATDWMVPGWWLPGGKAKGRKVSQAIWDERAQNGIWYVIHWGQIISTTRPSKGWLPYFARNDPNPSKSHKNHGHGSWRKDSDAPKVGQAKPPPVPPPSPEPEPEPAPFTEGWVPDLPWVFYLDRQLDGVKDSRSVWLLQKALGVKPYDGAYRADVLRPLVSKKQRGWGNSVPNSDGILGPRDAKRLFGKHVRIEASST